MTLLEFFGPGVIGVGFVAGMTLVRDPGTRLRLNAMIAIGASGIYLSGGAFGPWELVACAVIFACAYRGFRSWKWIGIAWLLHTGLDIAHAVTGVDLLPWAPHSSLGCAICDPVIALWCFIGGRPLDRILFGATNRLDKVRRQAATIMRCVKITPEFLTLVAPQRLKLALTQGRASETQGAAR